MGKVYEGDIGTVIELDVGEDISSSSTRRIYYTKPSGTTGFWAATLVGTSRISYTTESGNLDEDGVWSLQAYIVTASGTWRGETVKLRVYAQFT